MSKPLDPHYAVLDLNATATAEEIREAYLDLVKVWHPDRFSGESPRFVRKVEEKLKAINHAYEILRSGAPAFDEEAVRHAKTWRTADNPHLRPVSFGEFWGYVNEDGKLVIPPRFHSAEPFREGLALVQEYDRYGFIDRAGEYAVYPEFAEARGFSEGLAAVVLSYRWGYVDRRGGFRVNPNFDDAGEFREGLAPVKWRGRWGYVDRAGSLVIRPRFQDALPFDGGWARVRCGEEWGKANREGDVYIDGRRVFIGAGGDGAG